MTDINSAPMWDQRYAEPGYAYGEVANDYLRAEHTRIRPGGRILCLAEGQGRNAVFLAEQGYTVTAMDQSPVGLRRARELAAARGVSIATVIGDLGDFDLGTGWDAVVCIFGHTPPPIRQRIHGALRNALAFGGVYLLEAYPPRQLEMPGRGGPPPERRDFYMPLEAVKDELAGLTLEIARETERDIHEGNHHHGLSAVIQVAARASGN